MGALSQWTKNMSLINRAGPRPMGPSPGRESGGLLIFLQAASTKVVPGESQGSRYQKQGGVQCSGAHTDAAPPSNKITLTGRKAGDSRQSVMIQRLWCFRNQRP